jgi:hypothetical protein
VTGQLSAGDGRCGYRVRRRRRAYWLAGIVAPTFENGEEANKMEVPFTPLDFMRRARKLYGSREAVVDGARRFSYE